MDRNPTLTIKRTTTLTVGMLKELLSLMENQETTDAYRNETQIWQGEYGEYEITFDDHGNGVVYACKRV